MMEDFVNSLGMAKCVCCGAEYRFNEPPEAGWGNVRIELRTCFGTSFKLSGPLCCTCAEQAQNNPSKAMRVLRASCPNVLAPPHK